MSDDEGRVQVRESCRGMIMREGKTFSVTIYGNVVATDTSFRLSSILSLDMRSKFDERRSASLTIEFKPCAP